MDGLKAIFGMDYTPSFLSCRLLGGGNMQTFMTCVKANLTKMFLQHYQYDKIEEFTLSDGGKIPLTFKGSFDGSSKRPIVFYAPGQCSFNQYGAVRCMIDHLFLGDEEGGPGFDEVLLGYRGIGFWSDGKPVKLTTCRWYTVCSHEDIVEPFRYVYEKYCKPYGRKAFAFGNSFGSNLMINTMK